MNVKDPWAQDYTGDPDVICFSCYKTLSVLPRNTPSLVRHWQTHLPDTTEDFSDLNACEVTNRTRVLAQNPVPPPLHTVCMYIYSILIHTGKQG